MRLVTTTCTRQNGLSLIEMMIAMVVGLVLLAGVLSIFISSQRGYGANSASALVQEDGRFALDFIRNNLRMSSYMGCSTTARTNTVINSVGQLYNFLVPVYGFEYGGTDPGTATSAAPFAITSEFPAGLDLNAGAWAPAADGSTIAITNAIPGNDVLVLFSATGDPVYVTAPVAGGSIPVTSSTGLNAGQLAVISNCVASTAFEIGASDNNTPGTITVGGGSPYPGNSQSNFDVGYQTGTQVLTANVVVYYVGRGADGSPALFQVQLQPNGTVAAQQEMVPGVESMQVLYGVDTTGGSGLTTPNQYLTADQVDATNNWSNVLSVQIGLLIRSNIGAVPLPTRPQEFNLLDTYVTAPRDTRLRHVFTANVYLRNAPLPTS